MASPCAACKFLRRKCTNGCVFAPYFHPEDPAKFAAVHKVFGASNVAKILNELPSGDRDRAVYSLAYEARERIKDPVHGCVAHINYLHHQINEIQEQIVMARKELSTLTSQSSGSSFNPEHSLIAQNQLSAASPVTYMAGPYGMSNVKIGMDLGLGNSVAIPSQSAVPFRDMKEAQQHMIEMEALRQQNLTQLNNAVIEGVRGAYNGNFSTDISSSLPGKMELASSQTAQIQCHQNPQVPAQEFNGVFVARPPPPERQVQWQMPSQMQLPMQYYMEQMKKQQQQHMGFFSDNGSCVMMRRR